MLIGEGWARLGFARSSTADYYARGAMGVGGVEVAIMGRATALVAAAASLASIALTF